MPRTSVKSNRLDLAIEDCGMVYSRTQAWHSIRRICFLKPRKITEKTILLSKAFMISLPTTKIMNILKRIKLERLLMRMIRNKPMRKFLTRKVTKRRTMKKMTHRASTMRPWEQAWTRSPNLCQMFPFIREDRTNSSLTRDSLIKAITKHIIKGLANQSILQGQDTMNSYKKNRSIVVLHLNTTLASKVFSSQLLETLVRDRVVKAPSKGPTNSKDSIHTKANSQKCITRTRTQWCQPPVASNKSALNQTKST